MVKITKWFLKCHSGHKVIRIQAFSCSVFISKMSKSVKITDNDDLCWLWMTLIQHGFIYIYFSALFWIYFLNSAKSGSRNIMFHGPSAPPSNGTNANFKYDECMRNAYVTWSREMSHLSKISIPNFLYHFLITSICFIFDPNPIKIGDLVTELWRICQC